MNNHSKLILWITILLIIIIFSYRIYAPTSIQNLNALNLKNIQDIKENQPEDDPPFSFVVVGNIKNSISIFDNNILKRIRKDNPDFIISTGNNVVDGGEGKYRVLNRTLQRIDMPFVTGVGENEVDDEGYKNFYKYFGPFYFSFQKESSYFIFLDTTGHTSLAWQKDWLESELKKASSFENIFVIMNKPPFKIDANYLIKDKQKYIIKNSDRRYYKDIFAKYNVDSVFSSNLQLYRRRQIKGVDYFVIGGTGGELILDDKQSFYHYLRVDVTESGLNYNLVKIDNSFSTFNSYIVKFIGNLWIALQSFIYTNYITILLVILILFLIGFIIYLELSKEANYYRNYTYMKDDHNSRKLNIAMFTNNYFPYIGGVPISIYRLARGLRNQGHTVYIFAPEYSDEEEEDQHQDNEFVIRCNALYMYESDGMDMPVTNIFSPEIKNKFNELDIDVVHAHHPFWLGSRGLTLAEKENIPTVYTYHTRLEKYAHYLPNLLIAEEIFKKSVAHMMIKNFANRCNAVFAPTASAKEYLRNIGVSKYVEVLPTGVEIDKYIMDRDRIEPLMEKVKADCDILLFSVSRLSKEKNLYFLLKGLKYVRDNTDINFKCLIAGDGAEKENIEQFIRENNLEGYVELIGLIDNDEIHKYYMVSDIFVFASKSETQGMVLLEAMAGKTPVIAVRSSGIDDVIKNGFNGYKTRDEIEEWSQKIIKLMRNKDILEELSENAYQVAQDHSIASMAKRAAKVYNKTIEFKGESQENEEKDK